MPPPPVVIDLTTASPPPRSPIPFGVRAAPPIAIPLPEEKEEELTLEAVLHKEIATVREGTVRGLLQKICKAHPEAAQMAADVLLVQETDVRHLPAEESTDEEEEEKIEGEDKEEEQGNEQPSTEISTNALAKGVNDSTASDQLPKNSSTSPVANNTTSNKPISTNDGAETTGKKRYRGKFAICDNCEEQYDVSNNHKGDCTWHDGDLEVDWRGDFWADHDEDCHGEIDSEYMRKEYPEGFEWSCCGMSGNDEGCSTGRHVERIIREFKRVRYS